MMLAKKCCQNKQRRIKDFLDKKDIPDEIYKMLNVQDGRTEGNEWYLKNLDGLNKQKKNAREENKVKIPHGPWLSVKNSKQMVAEECLQHSQQTNRDKNYSIWKQTDIKCLESVLLPVTMKALCRFRGVFRTILSLS